MVQIKLSVAILLTAAAIAPVLALPVPRAYSGHIDPNSELGQAQIAAFRRVHEHYPTHTATHTNLSR